MMSQKGVLVDSQIDQEKEDTEVCKDQTSKDDVTEPMKKCRGAGKNKELRETLLK